jgi:hypothetical protein
MLLQHLLAFLLFFSPCLPLVLFLLYLLQVHQQLLWLLRQRLPFPFFIFPLISFSKLLITF